MRFETSRRITAAADVAWAVLVDVERWPESTPSMTSVRRLDGGPLRVGSRARVRQPRLPPAVWEVTDLVEHREFTWRSRSVGVTTVGRHLLTPDGDGVVLTLVLEQSGPLAPVVGRLAGGLTRRYVTQETEGLACTAERRA
ncbi:Polyketide cyclase / dehydrase and lipid transport [Amycolatopsis arida]|uniref:Polyketide cyclase / dehydrase and lipid transport n=1 Tax=Amycolatopsis arida TaxID=587909 RepID=A0A1I5LQG1_9PSEU|nr:SRPBCC family protein [Amycolatopsis arida]TDX93788.1 polyketide cyclase/dehydrase/lipid transport protein [Amycolatopsis arida]SFO99011.1 Polyketide cyclase / dehydrase and lipid transport [Amycolatopsis arida]